MTAERGFVSVARCNLSDRVVRKRRSQLRVLKNRHRQNGHGSRITWSRQIASPTVRHKLAGSCDPTRDHRNALCYRLLNHPRLAFPPARVKNHVEGCVERTHILPKPCEDDSFANPRSPKAIHGVVSHRAVPDEYCASCCPSREDVLQRSYECLRILLLNEPADPPHNFVGPFQT